MLVLCTFCVHVQGESVGLSMKYFPSLFTGIEHDIELIVSMNNINLFMYHLRGRKNLSQACTPPCNCTNEYHF